MAQWYQVNLSVSESMSDAVSGQLFDLGCSGVQVDDDAPSSLVQLTAYFPITISPEAVKAHLAPLFGEIHLSDVPDEDWTTAWRASFTPIFPSDRLTICPPWQRLPDPEGGFSIVIDPKMAFGTGHHETTRMALRGVESQLKPGARVLDMGTGSGILSIAAIKLGAGRVTGVDIDAQAIENARGNLALNGVSERVELISGSLDQVDGVFDLIVANMISSLLKPLLPGFKDRLVQTGCLVLGGILEREQDDFIEAIHQVDLSVESVHLDGEWVGVIAKPVCLDG